MYADEIFSDAIGEKIQDVAIPAVTALGGTNKHAEFLGKMQYVTIRTGQSRAADVPFIHVIVRDVVCLFDPFDQGEEEYQAPRSYEYLVEVRINLRDAPLNDGGYGIGRVLTETSRAVDAAICEPNPRFEPLKIATLEVVTPAQFVGYTQTANNFEVRFYQFTAYADPRRGDFA